MTSHSIAKRAADDIDDSALGASESGAGLAREIVRERKIMMMLGTMTAEQRLAAFLIDLSERYRARGYSSCEFECCV
jgi:CRP-like cAMP-binding protein